MKRIFFLVVTSFLELMSVYAQKNTTFIKGTLVGAPDGTKLYLNTLRPDLTDSAIVKNSSFTFKKKIDGPLEARIYIDNHDQMPASNAIKVLWIEKGSLSLTAHYPNLATALVKGSKSDLEYLNYMHTFQLEGKEADGNYRDSDAINILQEYVKRHPSSYKGAMELYLYRGVIPIAKIDQLYRGLSVEIKSSLYGKLLHDLIMNRRSATTGNIVPDFTVKCTDGKVIDAANYRGKYLLISFWGSWCGPCRYENKELKPLYAKYRSKGFEVLGLGIDDQNSFAKAIIADGILWPNALLDHGFDNPVSQTFGVWSLPHTLLIGPDGKIIGMDFRSFLDNNLSKKLIEIFGE